MFHIIMLKVPINPELIPIEKQSNDNLYPDEIENPGNYWKNNLRYKLKCKKEALEVQWSNNSTNEITNDKIQPFFGAILEAYNNHKDILLEPDTIWMVICLNFSKFVKDNADEMRNQFVCHQDVKNISVTDNHSKGEKDWNNFFVQIKEEINKNMLNDIVDTLIANFTTTTEISTILSSVCIMDAFQEYFSYGRMIPCCGIRNVYFSGKIDDWEKLLEKLRKLGKYGKFSEYVDKVVPIIIQFINSMKGSVDIEWWNKIMNIEMGLSGSATTKYVTGWIVDLCLPIEDRDEDEDDNEGKIEFNDLILPTIKVPVKVQCLITKKISTVYITGGFYGYEETDNIISPCMSLAVIEYFQDRDYKIDLKSKMPTKNKNLWMHLIWPLLFSIIMIIYISYILGSTLQ